MGRRAWFVLAFALLLTCGPTAVPRSDSSRPSATTGPILANDLITLREGGQAPALAVRKVENGQLVRSVPDGILLPDGTSVLTLATAGADSTLIAKIDRRTGATLSSRSIAGAWQRGPFSSGTSPDGSRIVLFGSSYNFTDASGAWTARTMFGVIAVATWHVDTVVLNGRYAFEAVSNDGRALYVEESVPPQLPTSTRLRVYDVPSAQFSDVTGDALPSLDAYRTPATGLGAFSFRVFAAKDPVLVRFDLGSRDARTLTIPMDRTAQGEQVVEWSLVATRDGRTLYAINPAVGTVTEIDPVALRVRRSASLNASRSDDAIDALVAAMHPVAAAKMGFGTGAVLSPDESTLYALAETGVWSIATGSLSSHMLTKDGAYESIKPSPDGNRLYVLGRENGVISALDARDGHVLGAMERIAFPSDIVAVDAG